MRILSPGDDGDVSQSNLNVAGALAANGNSTGQAIDQSQGGSGGGTQVAGQKADNTQTADAYADATQVHPSNTNISVRILSPGSNGAVSQSNTNVAGALAANVNSTCQCISQQQAGGPGGSSTQIAGQSAKSEQDATADASAKQIKPTNDNISIRVLSPGADGPVAQSNTNIALSGALNGNETSQGIDQSQGGSGGGVQAAGQQAWNGQSATSSAIADQVSPSNLNVPVRVLSPGDSGAVEQSNTTLAGSLAANGNHTAQWIDQGQSGGPGGPAVQAAGQYAGNRQSADAVAEATQCCASNVNAPVAVLSRGGSGSVQQSNDVAALAAGLNLNGTTQSIAQHQGGGGSPAIQAAGQKAWNDQAAHADADALQVGASNVNAPVRVLEPKKKTYEPKRYEPTKHEPKQYEPKQYEPKRGSCGRQDGCKRADPCTHRSACRPVEPETKKRTCRYEPRDTCAKRYRCEAKDACPARQAPKPARYQEGLMPMA